AVPARVRRANASKSKELRGRTEAVHYRSEQEEVVPAGSGDLEGALGGGLAADVGEVAGGERRGGEEGSGVDRGRDPERVAAEMRDRVRQRLDADDRRAARE